VTTLGYFPQLYPGELLYSVLARYHQHMGARSSIQSMESLFGRRLMVACVDLPGHLDALVERMKLDCPITADDIIDDMTLLPYYVAFQPQDSREEARKAMKSGQTDGLMMSLGMTAFRPGRVRKLRFCGTCMSQMQDAYGEAYWRRDHQLPGVLVCPDHARVLQESHVSLGELSRHVFVTPTAKSCPWNAKTLLKDTSTKLLPVLQRLAQASRKLLESPERAKTQEQWTKHYRGCMESAGLTYSPKRMDQQRLKEGFFHHHNEILCLMPHVSLGDGFAGDWLAQIVRKHRKAFHPLHHLLFQDFLDHFGTRQARFGQGPWLCRNPLSNHQGTPSIKAVTQHRNKGHWVGVFECVCGYTYTRSYFSATATIGEPRFHSYGKLFGPEIRKLVKEQWSLRAISRRLELDPKTVIRLATELGITTPWTARDDVTPKPIAVAVKTSSQTSSPKATVCAKQPRQSKDWEKVDTNLSSLVRSAAGQLKKQVPPIRVTTLRIERSLSGRGWISKRTEKLPKVMSCLTTVTESVTAFQHRRVTWVIHEMDLANEPLQVWKVLRRAGLTMRNVDMVDQALIAHFCRRSYVA
jgi:hypothetical protein